MYYANQLTAALLDYMHTPVYAHGRLRTRPHSQRWLIARWWKIMCDLTDWWICLCFSHPSVNTDICNRANARTHTHTRTAILTIVPTSIGEKWLTGSGSSLRARSTHRSWSVIKGWGGGGDKSVIIKLCDHMHIYGYMRVRAWRS